MKKTIATTLCTLMCISFAYSQDKTQASTIKSSKRQIIRALYQPKSSKNQIVKSKVNAGTNDQQDYFFTGTKNFLDNDQSWEYVVTIKGQSIVIQCYPGKNNTVHKNKTPTITTGYIKNGKIYTKEPNGKYISDLYLYKKNQFMTLNNENEYNVYELEGNDTLISNYVHSDSRQADLVHNDSAEYKTPISLRKFVNLITPHDAGLKTGKIAVRLKIDKSGVVIDAIAGVKGTTLNDRELWKRCEEAVMDARFTASESAPDVQIAVVVFNFKVK
ncbi:energy transducer TonB [Pedobacter gandavensis]|uniref:energy transducer TonB n=1 Tax=Pedobacter gandavensis TaxID=2679963 RepID=UPI0029313BC3|nr:energy transducer TonB [Pedobacter gandavensis]